MQRFLFPLFVFVGSLAAVPLDHRPPAEVAVEMKVERVCFGSCARQEVEQPIWERVVEREPDLYIWLGDNIYGDSRNMMVIAREGEKWTGKYAKGSMELKAEGRVLEGTWKDGDRGGKCRFELTRDGMNMLGRSGRGDGPVLLNWSGWREAK